MKDDHDSGKPPCQTAADPLPIEAKSAPNPAESARADGRPVAERVQNDSDHGGKPSDRTPASPLAPEAKSAPDAAEATHANGRPATYQDVLDAPENMVAEVVGGILYTQPRPAPPHAMAYSLLGGMIAVSFGRKLGDPGGWWILDEPELHLGPDPEAPDILVPDIAGWRHETMPRPPAKAYFTVPPNWVCEILSPSTRDHDLEDKLPIYAREGIGHLWLLDPDCRRLDALELRNGAWATVGEARDNETVCLPPFQAIRFSLGELWWPDPPEADEPKPKPNRNPDSTRSEP